MERESEIETLDGMRERLLRQLASSGETTSLSSVFGALNSNLTRVNFALDLLDRFEISPDFIQDHKDDSVANEMRKAGNEMYKRKALEKCWEMYTKSAMLAAERETLALAYANRSAVLYELGLHKECAEDIDRALSIPNYPKNLRPKLIQRRQKCTQQQSDQSQPHEKIPSITNPNAEIPCASTSIKIAESADLGRHIVATEDIEPGAILCIEPPFMTVLIASFLTHCHQCLKLSYNLEACENCTQALFCNKCRSAGCHDNDECVILKTCRAMRLDKLKMLPLKIAMRLDDSTVAARYNEVSSLVSNENKRSVSDLFGRAVNAAILYELVRKNTNLFESSDTEKFKDALMLHLQTGPSNFHEITELIVDSSNCQLDEFASGVFPFLSLFNHSCDPNVTRFCYGPSILVRAVKNIKKGEQCCDNYGYHYAIHDKNSRQSHLASQYHFDCQCEACDKNWAEYQQLPHLEGLHDEFNENDVIKLTTGDVSTAYSIAPKLELLLSKLQRFQPCQNFCRVQEVLKQAYAVMGNKRHPLFSNRQ